MVKVENMISNKGNAIANQFIIEIDGEYWRIDKDNPGVIIKIL